MNSLYNRFFKRIFDIIGALFLLILLLPLFILITIILYFQNSGQPFFFQVRPGKNEKPFTLIKFRSMTNEKDAQGNLLPDKDRITKVGKVVRSTSLDEIPQLLNVLKGEMSFIGPRPLLVKYLDLYSNRQKKRHAVRPGITGWAQVNGRNKISWTERFEFDLEYVENISFYFDLKIVFLTIQKVVNREGISSETSATMEPFNGNN